MSSPQKVTKDTLMGALELKFSKLNYEKYRDMEDALTEEDIIEFILKQA